MKVGYVRVSTMEQNEERQIEGLSKYGIEKWYTEKVSGKNMDRPELQKLLSDVQNGDIVYVHDFSRLARSTKDLLDIVDKLNEHGVHVVSSKEGMDTSTPQGRFTLTVLAAAYEMERTAMLERQAEGIAIAKREGKYKNCGRKKKELADGYEDLIRQYVDGSVSKVQLAVMLNVSRPTLNRILEEYGEG